MATGTNPISTSGAAVSFTPAAIPRAAATSNASVAATARCVGAAGSMLVLIIDVTPPLGPAYTLLAFVIVITGGLGSMPGALLGGVLIGMTEAMAGLLFTPSAKSMFAFAILVLVLLFRPQGILGKRASS